MAQLLKTLANATKDALQDRDSGLRAEGGNEQWNHDVIMATCAMLELTQDNVIIYDLLDRYMGIHTIENAKKVIEDARQHIFDKKINALYRQLYEYFRQKGKTARDAREYMYAHNMESKLHNDPKLFNLEISALLSAVESMDTKGKKK